MLMNENIIKRANELKAETIAIRRDLHKFPEGGFFEYRTVSIIVKYLSKLGFEVKYGSDVLDVDHVLGMPSDSEIEFAKKRAVSEGADEDIVSSIPNGATAVVATLRGKCDSDKSVVAFRFDMDCNEITESCEVNHKPVEGGYSSVHNGYAHTCGHDGHVAIGLTLAKILSENTDKFSGVVKLIFQPAEEGVRGASAMVAAGIVDDVDYFFSGHIGISAKESKTVYTSTTDFLCATKFNAEFFGKSTHAGLKPEEGKNALLAAAQAALSLHGISRHSAGASRINVGVISGGSGRNVIPSYAQIQFETRGENSNINNFMKERARTIVDASALMFDVDYKLECVGDAESFVITDNFDEELAALALETRIYDKVETKGSMNASEDCTAFMNRVESHGGKATYMMFGSNLASQHHTPTFDFDEQTLTDAAAFLAITALKYAN